MAKLIGLMRLGRDAEVKTLPSGKKVANLALAYNFGLPNENKERPTQWVDASLWGDRAESLAPFLTKGSLHEFTIVDVHMESYADKEGFQAWKLTGTVLDIELGPKQSGSGSQQNIQNAARRPAQGDQPAQRPQQGQQHRPANRQTGTGFDDMDDSDVPF